MGPGFTKRITDADADTDDDVDDDVDDRRKSKSFFIVSVRRQKKLQKFVFPR